MKMDVYTVVCGSQEGDSVISKSLAEEPGSLNFMTRSPLDIARPFFCE